MQLYGRRNIRFFACDTFAFDKTGRHTGHDQKRHVLVPIYLGIVTWEVQPLECFKISILLIQIWTLAWLGKQWFEKGDRTIYDEIGVWIKLILHVKTNWYHCFVNILTNANPIWRKMWLIIFTHSVIHGNITSHFSCS